MGKAKGSESKRTKKKRSINFGLSFPCMHQINILQTHREICLLGKKNTAFSAKSKTQFASCQPKIDLRVKTALVL